MTGHRGYVAVPREAFDALVQVAEYVSYGRRAVDHQPDGAPYPDAAARRALGVLDDAGLLTAKEPAHGDADAQRAFCVTAGTVMQKYFPSERWIVVLRASVGRDGCSSAKHDLCTNCG